MRLNCTEQLKRDGAEHRLYEVLPGVRPKLRCHPLPVTTHMFTGRFLILIVRKGWREDRAIAYPKFTTMSPAHVRDSHANPQTLIHSSGPKK
jgi:hypothetical protein